MQTFAIDTHDRCELVDVTAQTAAAVRESGVRRGMCLVFTPHTTAGITINENADPDVARDLLAGLERVAPQSAGYRHGEGNSDAHIKSSLVGCSEYAAVEDGALVLGTWQGIYLCEFDGPRRRKVHVQVLGNG